SLKTNRVKEKSLKQQKSVAQNDCYLSSSVAVVWRVCVCVCVDMYVFVLNHVHSICLREYLHEVFLFWCFQGALNYLNGVCVCECVCLCVFEIGRAHV